MNGFYYFCWKSKNTKNPYPGFSNIFKETFSVLPCYEISRSTEYGLIEISVINSYRTAMVTIGKSCLICRIRFGKVDETP